MTDTIYNSASLVVIHHELKKKPGRIKFCDQILIDRVDRSELYVISSIDILPNHELF